MYDNDLIMWEANSGMTIGHLWDNHWDDYDKPSPIINPTFWGSAFTTHQRHVILGYFGHGLWRSTLWESNMTSWENCWAMRYAAMPYGHIVLSLYNAINIYQWNMIKYDQIVQRSSGILG